jgi:oxalate decarboxylase/phosphoglucose isomerase-like protein (cupin superfamily)
MMVSFVEMPEQLPEVLTVLHEVMGKKDEQTIRGGTQVNLDTTGYKSIKKLLRAIAPEVQQYVNKPWTYQGIWSSRMEKGGYHVRHAHPKGSISGVYYVSTGEGGDLLFDDRPLSPEPGMLVLFTSDTPHATTPYRGEKPRVTVAFDVVMQ